MESTALEQEALERAPAAPFAEYLATYFSE